MRNAFQYLGVAAATGFGLGFSPVASGTAGTLLGIPIMLVLIPVWNGAILGQICCGMVLALIAVPLCGLAEKTFRHKDDRRIVADEYCTFPICMIGLPVNAPVLALAFITNRVFDIIKPPPAYQAQKLPGGLGIVADDAISAIYSLALNHVLFRLLMKYGFIYGS